MFMSCFRSRRNPQQLPDEAPKIEPKEERGAVDGTFLHTEKQVELVRLVERLSFDDCQTLFERIRRLGTDEAEALVREYTSPVIQISN